MVRVTHQAPTPLVKIIASGFTFGHRRGNVGRGLQRKVRTDGKYDIGIGRIEGPSQTE